MYDEAIQNVSSLIRIASMHVSIVLTRDIGFQEQMKHAETRNLCIASLLNTLQFHRVHTFSIENKNYRFTFQRVYCHATLNSSHKLWRMIVIDILNGARSELGIFIRTSSSSLGARPSVTISFGRL